MKRQFGSFLVLVGSVLLFLFFISNFAETPIYKYLFYGMIVLLTGVFILQRSKPAPTETGRFRLFRRRKKDD